MSFCFSLICSFVFADNYYLSPDGSDTLGDGSYNNPWFSPSKARKSKSSIKPGDTVIFKSGAYSYSGTSCLLGYNSDDAGTADKPITYRPETQGSVTIDFNSNWGWRLDVSTSSNIILDGFILVNTIAGVRLSDTNQVARNICVTATPAWPPSGNPCSNATGSGGFIGDGSNFLVENNIADNCSADVSSHGIYIHSGSGIVRNNTFRNNLGNGIQIQNNGNYPKMGTILVYSNKVYNNSGRHGIYSSAYNPGGEIGDVYIYNNIIWNNSKDYSSGWGITATSPDTQRDYVLIAHNTLFDNMNGIRAGGCINGGIVANNIIYMSSSTSLSVTDDNIIVQDNMTCDPAFISSNELNDYFFMLASTSPAIDACEPVGVETDFRGNIRPSGLKYDTGAFEMTESSNPAGCHPNCPINLRIQ